MGRLCLARLGPAEPLGFARLGPTGRGQARLGLGIVWLGSARLLPVPPPSFFRPTSGGYGIMSHRQIPTVFTDIDTHQSPGLLEILEISTTQHGLSIPFAMPRITP